MNIRALIILIASLTIIECGYCGDLHRLVTNETEVNITEDHLITLEKLSRLFDIHDIHAIHFKELPPRIQRFMVILTHEDILPSGIIAQKQLEVLYDESFRMRHCSLVEQDFAYVTIGKERHRVRTNLSTAQAVQNAMNLFIEAERSFENEEVKAKLARLNMEKPSSLHISEEDGEQIYSIFFQRKAGSVVPCERKDSNSDLRWATSNPHELTKDNSQPSP